MKLIKWGIDESLFISGNSYWWHYKALLFQEVVSLAGKGFELFFINTARLAIQHWNNNLLSSYIVSGIMSMD